MFKINENFEGRVKSISFEKDGYQATVGVIAPGKYDIETTMAEYITITSGLLEVQLPDSDKWTTYEPYETFIIEKNSSFKIRLNKNITYLCVYK